jgi:ElaB/YqjD/DUF883 family membrane-anchored ribosome-binding protein
MNTNPLKDPPFNRLPAAAREAAGNASASIKEAAQFATDAVKDGSRHAADAAHNATEAAKEMCHDMSAKAEETMIRTKEYVRENPVPVVLGALAIGVALGYMLVMARREPTFRERYVDEPLDSAREAIIAALAPVAQRLHEGYDTARDGAGKAMDRAHRFNPSRTIDSISEQLGRVGSNLKFW